MMGCTCPGDTRISSDLPAAWIFRSSGKYSVHGGCPATCVHWIARSRSIDSRLSRCRICSTPSKWYSASSSRSHCARSSGMMNSSYIALEIITDMSHCICACSPGANVLSHWMQHPPPFTSFTMPYTSRMMRS